MNENREMNRIRAERLIERLNEVITKGAEADREIAKIATERSAFTAFEQSGELIEISYRGLLAADMLEAFSDPEYESLELPERFEAILATWTESIEDALIDGPPSTYAPPARDAAELIRHHGKSWFIRRVIRPA